MAIVLNERAYRHAQNLIRDGRLVADDRDAWSEHQPSARQGNEFLDEHGFDEYQVWYLGMDEAERGDTKARYKFPYGDYSSVHRCAVLSAESRAGQYKHADVERAAAHLHGMIDGAH